MKLVFKSLFNNNACITGARRKGKWWVSIILFFVSLIFAVIPAFVSTITTKGSSLILQGSMSGLDYAFVDFVDTQKGTITLKIQDGDSKGEKILVPEGWDAVENVRSYEYTNTVSGNVDAVFYYTDEPWFISEVTKNHERTRIFFSKDSFYIDLVKVDNPGTSTTFGCNHAWKDFETGSDLMDLFIGNNCTTFEEKYESVRSSITILFDKTYNYNRVANSFMSVGLYSTINAVIVLLMGFMIWVLTRGKANTFRHYKIYDGLKISMWASLAPAVLTIPFGFLFAGFANMLFPLLLGVRSMWLASNSLRPDGTGYDEPKEIKTVNVKSK